MYIHTEKPLLGGALPGWLAPVPIRFFVILRVDQIQGLNGRIMDVHLAWGSSSVSIFR